MDGDWPFQNPPNHAVITLTRIIDGARNPILYVVHDAAGDWQFLDGDDVSEGDAAIVALREVVELDPTIELLADLPLGWGAERETVAQPWERFER